jgi:PAS domain S-box-containing protein
MATTLSYSTGADLAPPTSDQNLQTGRSKFTPAPGDLDALCAHVVNDLAELPGNQGRIRYECAPRPMPAFFDPRLLQQAISNLLHNALKYSPPGKSVRVTLAQAAGRITLRVTDEGIGIPAEDLQHIFEPFHRAANVGTIQGTGLGLAIVKEANRVRYSREWKRQLGYDEHEIGDDFGEWEQRIHPDDRERALATALTYAAAPWPNYEQEFRMRHKDGTYRWILAQAALVYGEDGQAIRMLGSHIDITEKKHAELAVAEAERFARRCRRRYKQPVRGRKLCDGVPGGRGRRQ